MSGYNCCFLACIQVSQETGKVVWYFHFFKNFPQFVVSTPSKALAWSMKQIFFFIPLLFLWSRRCWQFDLWFLWAFLNPACTFGSSWVMCYWSLAQRIFMYLLVHVTSGHLYVFLGKIFSSSDHFLISLLFCYWIISVLIMATHSSNLA